jgi:hypothetical protein
VLAVILGDAGRNDRIRLRDKVGEIRARGYRVKLQTRSKGREIGIDIFKCDFGNVSGD